jgi:CheY-like chemotaxis protein
LRLGQILLNLGNNAVKFTQSGSIHVKVEATARSDQEIRLHFSVRDTGIGMSSEQCARLFQSFSQADGSTTRKYGGTGLGLVISKRMVEMMGGNIWVVSELGQGSVFHFRLPFGLVQGAGPDDFSDSVIHGGAGEIPTAAEDVRATLRGARLLLVEDNEMNQELVLELLADAGISAALANNGAEALQLLASDGDFDGVLMDCQMPVMDGYAATRKLRSNPLWAHLPVIAMTANAMAGDRAKALEAGMNDHVAKPLNVPEMFATIARWIKPGQHRSATPEPTDRGAARALVAPMPPLVGIDTRVGLGYASGNPALYRRMLTNFLRSQTDFEQRFSSARRSADSQASAREAHTLKSTAGSIGAQGLQQAAQELEMACLQRAPQAHTDALFETVKAELWPVLASLQSLSAPSLEPVGSAPMANLANSVDVRRMLEQLHRYCQDSDSEAIELSEKLLVACAGTSSEKAASQLKRVLADFEFDQAQDLIRGLLMQLDPA